MPNGTTRTVVLNFITPHQKWGIHSTYTDNLLMLTSIAAAGRLDLSRRRQSEPGIVDNDWVEVFNTNGALTARAVVVPADPRHVHVSRPGKIVNTPGSEITPASGRHPQLGDPRVLKPTHMIGGYASLTTVSITTARRLQPRRIRHRPQDEQGRLAGTNRAASEGGFRMKIRAQIGWC